ncbi:MAG: hypothetical protein GY851_01670 [bacterium]|nr:hypothetical protein [bacterium]
MEIVSTLIVVLFGGGIAALLVGRILGRAEARARDETTMATRLARYAGPNRGLTVVER